MSGRVWRGMYGVRALRPPFDDIRGPGFAMSSMDYTFVRNGSTRDAFDANLRMAVQQCKEKTLDEVVGAAGEITRNELVSEICAS